MLIFTQTFFFFSTNDAAFTPRRVKARTKRAAKGTFGWFLITRHSFDSLITGSDAEINATLSCHELSGSVDKKRVHENMFLRASEGGN